LKTGIFWHAAMLATDGFGNRFFGLAGTAAALAA